MALKMFMGFDPCDGESQALMLSGVMQWQTGSTQFPIPPWLFHNKGLATLDQSIHPPAPASTTTKSAFMPRENTLAFGCCYFPTNSTSTMPINYGAATATTRAVWATAQGAQLAIARNQVPGGLSANEYWFSFEVCPPNFNSVDMASGYEPTADWAAIFRWGDVQIRAKSATRNNTTGYYNMVFSVRNNGTEIATITVPQVNAGGSFASTSWLWVLVKVKLHATTGSIEAYINGNGMSASYTNQNTVNTIANASENGMYFGPIVMDNGTNAYVGGLDSIIIDDAAWPSGRPTVRFWAVASDGTLTNAAAAGTSPTTVANAIATGSTTSRNDAKQLRFSAVSGRAELNMTAPSTTGFNTQVLGFFGILQRAASRNPTGARRIRPSVKVSGVDYQDAIHSAVSLPFSSIVTPPETLGVNVLWFTDKAGSRFTTTDLSTAQLVLESITA